ncbi:hypothetical protein J2857_006182 [Neorhizobium galegae]|uniref:hypothetical protein n=1 Tax=Neorhizobium galegae TaxID=399 RepID=UPI001AE822AA|nr:hypothetical protein [Neorhizobium galegae]MBP2563383.1 hypothetical protein [Neorhizobium galegae]
MVKITPGFRARQELSLAKSHATAKVLSAAMLVDDMESKLLRAMDRRDPWTGADLIGWVTEQYPSFLAEADEPEIKIAEFADEVAGNLQNDPAFPLIVANLRQMATECRSIYENRAGEAR